MLKGSTAVSRVTEIKKRRGDYLPHGNRDSGLSFQEILTASRICNTLRAPRTRDTLEGRAQSQFVA